MLAVLAAIALLLANTVTMVTAYIQLHRLRRELEQTQIVVRDCDEIRAAVAKPLEGTWEVRGSFERFQGESGRFYTSGYMVFQWAPSRMRYQVLYVYSLFRAKDPNAVTTVISTGISDGEVTGRLADSEVRLDMSVQSRVARDGSQNEVKAFTLTMKSSKSTGSGVLTLSGQFNNASTSGEIRLER